MRKNKKISCCLLSILFIINAYGCAPLIIGAAVGAVGGYAATKNTIQGETDIPFNNLWGSALDIARRHGNIQEENFNTGTITLTMESNKTYIRLIRLTRSTTRLKISSRKYGLPNLTLSQDLFIKIMEQAKR